jgi:hypothetical protein
LPSLLNHLRLLSQETPSVLATYSLHQTDLPTTSQHEPHREHRFLTIPPFLQGCFSIVARVYISAGTYLLPLLSNELFRVSTFVSQYDANPTLIHDLRFKIFVAMSIKIMVLGVVNMYSC